MELMHISTVPAKLATKDGLGKVSDHIYITMSDKVASVVMIPEGADSGLAIQMFIDMSDVDESKLNQEHATELSIAVMDVVMTVNDETVNSFVNDAQRVVFDAAINTARDEWNKVVKKINARNNPAISFMVTNGSVYSLDMETLNWDELIQNIGEFIGVLQFLRQFWNDLYKGNITKERINEGTDYIQEAFKRMNLDPDYSKCVNENSTLIEKLAPAIYDLTVIYSQMITNIVVKRDELVFSTEIENLMAKMKAELEASNGTNEEPVPEEADPEAPEASEEVVDIIDEIADSAEPVDAEQITEGEE